MWQLVLGAVLALVSNFVLQQANQGGRRWRALTTAKHELEVAAQNGLDERLAEALRVAANKKVDRYLAPGRHPTAGLPTRVYLAAVLIDGLFLVCILLIVQIVFVLPGWAFLVASAVLGLLSGALDGPVVRLLAVLHRRDQRRREEVASTQLSDEVDQGPAC